MLQANNYASSIKSYVDFLTKVDTTAPDVLYGAKWGHLVQKTLKNHYFSNFSIPSIHNTIKKASNYGSSIEAYVYFSIMVDAMEPGAPYGVK